MEETGFHRLDPTAQEFVPRNPNHHHPHLHHQQQQQQQFSFVSNNLFYPSPPYFHPSPLPPPPSPDLSSSSSSSRTLAAFYQTQQPFFPPSSPAYVSTDHYSWPARNMPSRALLLTMVPSDVSESTVRRELEIFGDVRAVQMDRVREGIVTVHFYDLRESQKALSEIQEQHMQQQYRLRTHYESFSSSTSNISITNNILPRPPPPLPPPAPGLISGRAVWAQFTAPIHSTLPDGNNQGTLVVFNLDPDVTTTFLKHTFEAFGDVKELRETPMKRHQRFVEFYDIREAAKALAEMNGKEINGKQIVIEFSRPGGISSKKNTKFSPASNFHYYHHHHSPRPSRIMMPSPAPDRRRSFSSGYYKVGNPSSEKRNLLIQNSMASLNVNDNSNNSTSHCTMTNTVASADASTAVVIKQQQQHPHISSSNSMNSKKNNKKISSCNNQYQFHHHHHNQQQAKGGGSSSSTSKPWKGGSSSRQAKEYDPRFLINEDAITESNCRDSRTTVMIKNIPNKYSQKLLLNMLDNHCIHCNEQITDGDDQPLSSYDFVYLPIDFVNKCNVGYGFVNMTSPEATLRLYKAFHRQSWEVFNSRKICEVTYARLQGIEALKEHFKNSKFPCESDEYMPVIFSPPRDGRILTDPLPIISRNSGSPSGISRTTSTNLTCCSSSSTAVDSSKEEEIDDEEDETNHEFAINGHHENEENGGDSGDDNDGGRTELHF